MTDRCSNPGCTDEATYTEPVSEAKRAHTPQDRFPVCQRHVDPTKDDVQHLE